MQKSNRCSRWDWTLENCQITVKNKKKIRVIKIRKNNKKKKKEDWEESIIDTRGVHPIHKIILTNIW